MGRIADTVYLGVARAAKRKLEMLYYAEAYALAFGGIAMALLLLLQGKTKRTRLAKIAVVASVLGLFLCSRYLFVAPGISSELIVAGTAIVMAGLGIEGLKQRTSPS